MPATPPLTVGQASQLSGVPKRTIQYAITTGALKAHKLPGITTPYLIDSADLADWIAKREKASA